MRPLELPEWSDRKWLRSVRRQFRNWLPATIQMVSSVETVRPGLRVIQQVAHWTGWPHPVAVELRGGPTVRTTDARHLAGLLESGWKVVVRAERLEMTGPDGTHLLVRPIDRESRDLCSLFETWVRGDYGLTFRGMNVLDVGGGNGDSAICFAARGAAKVVTVEPDPRSLEMLRENLALNPTLRQISLIEAGVTADGSPLELPLSTPYATVSRGAPLAAPPETVKVPGLAVARLLEMVPKVDLLKVDIEGGEYAVLRAIPSDGWTRIGAVRLEFHRGLQELPELFESHGFEVTASMGVSQGLLFASRVT